MKKNVFLVTMLGMVLAFGLVLVGCDDGNDGNEEISNEQFFAEVWEYFGRPETHNWTDNGGLTENTGFRFYDESYDIVDLGIVETYWDSLPDDETFYDNRWPPYVRDWMEPTLWFELQLHRGEDGNTWFQIEINYPNGDGYVTNEGLGSVVPRKILEITKTMVNLLQ